MPTKAQLAPTRVLTIQPGDPVFTDEDVSFIKTDLQLFLPFPEDIRGEIQQWESDHHIAEKHILKYNKPSYFDGSLTDIRKKTGIDDLEELIEEQRREIAILFMNRRSFGQDGEPADGCIFNNNKFGISYLDLGHYSSDQEELPQPVFYLYETDYFTHKVFNKIYKDLNAKSHPIGEFSLRRTCTKYRSFLTSVGVNNVVICRRKGKWCVVLTRRSESIADMGGDIHITMNEGFSLVDLDKQHKIPSIRECLLRGLEEEIGIEEDEVKHWRYCDIFITMKDHQIGLSSYSYVDLPFEEVRDRPAKTKNLETTEFIPLAFNGRAIENYIRKHRKEFLPHGLHVLQMFLKQGPLGGKAPSIPLDVERRKAGESTNDRKRVKEYVYVDALTKRGDYFKERKMWKSKARNKASRYKYDYVIDETKNQLRVRGEKSPYEIHKLTKAMKRMLWLVLTHKGSNVTYSEIREQTGETDAARIQRMISDLRNLLRTTSGERERVIAEGSGEQNYVQEKGWSFLWIRKKKQQQASELLLGE